jgi:hypothetical protein
MRLRRADSGVYGPLLAAHCRSLVVAFVHRQFKRTGADEDLVRIAATLRRLRNAQTSRHARTRARARNAHAHISRRDANTRRAAVDDGNRPVRARRSAIDGDR